MAEPTKFLVENEAISQGGGLGSMFDFSSGGSIFSVPSSILGGSDVTGFGAPTFLGGAGPTFSVPFTGSTLAGAGLGPGEISFFQPSGQIAPGSTYIAPADFAVGGGNPFATFGTAPLERIETGETTADLSKVNITGTPFNNAPIGGVIETNVPNVAVSASTTPSGETVTTNYAGAGDVTTLPAFTVTGERVTPQTATGQIYSTTPTFPGGAAFGGTVTTEAPGATVVMDPFQVTGTREPAQFTLNLAPGTTQPTAGGTDAGVPRLPTMVVSETRQTTPTATPEQMRDLLNQATQAWGQTLTLPPVTVGTGGTVTPEPVTTTIPPVTPPPIAPIIPPAVSVPTTTTPTPTVPTPLPSTPAPTTVTGGTATPTTTTTSSAMTQRDLKAELEKTMAAFNEYRPQIQQMYGDLYQQFMPKGLTAAEPGIINQYQADLARLQQRQAGMLSPEDIRQSQQSAREAYGARGQVMGPGAIGAEILNREAIRQQREDQARAALQSSYGNVLNMANLQTGNLFSPIASLMSGTFNPLGAYPADVYGTNVNAQLARDIAQKNYEAAIRSAELAGAAGKSAATTSAAGNIFGPAIGGVLAKGAGALFGLPIPSCMPGDQCIDTPTGPKAIKDLKGGDAVIGYDGNVAFIAQACSWNQDPLRTFLKITREDGSSFTVCDDHKIMGIPAMEWVEGAELAGSKIKAIEKTTGLLTSYDILTNQGGYRINGVPVNSMIPEIIMQVVEFHRQVDRNLQAASA